MRADEFMKKYGFDKDKGTQERSHHSLRDKALEHARDIAKHRPHAGTPYDWEDWERFHQQSEDDRY